METITINEFQPTISLAQVYLNLSGNPMWYFDNYRLKEIREACVEAMRKDLLLHGNSGRALSDSHAEWLESRIRFLRERGEYDLARELLRIYVNNSWGVWASRALEFVFNYACQSALGKDSARLVATRILKDHSPESLYRSISGMDAFVGRIFDEFIQNCNTDDSGPYSGEYSPSDWITLEQMLRIIVHVRDVVFHSRVQKILLLLRKKLIRPTGFKNPLARDEHMARLASVSKFLIKIRRDETKKKES